MRRLLLVAAIAGIAGCHDSQSSLAGPAAEPLGLTLTKSIPARVESDPYYIAAGYTTLGIWDTLGVSPSIDLETVPDTVFALAGNAMISATEEDVYEYDGLDVEEGVLYLIYQDTVGGGGGGGGEEPEMMFGGGYSTNYEDEGDGSIGICEDQYARDSGRCRKLVVKKARAICWGAIMTKYAACRALQE